MHRTKSRGLTAKLSLGTTIPMVAVVLLMGLIMVLIARNTLESIVERNADATAGLVQELVDSEFTGGVRNYLRGTAEAARDLMEFYHQQAESGRMSHTDAVAAYSTILLDPEYGRIGSTGYLAAVGTDGVLEIHPLSQGVDASGAEFMQQAMAMRSGYLEYWWQNVGEAQENLKAGYLAYFEPWELMVWASANKNEFVELIDRNAFDERISSVELGSGGYVMLLDRALRVQAGSDYLGVVPKLAGAESRGSGLVYMVSSERGRTRVELRPEPQLNWVVAVVSPLGGYDRMIGALWVIILATVVLTGLFMHLLTRILVGRMLRPMQKMQQVVDLVSSGDLSGQVPVVSSDEIGHMAALFNEIVGEFSRVLLRMREAVTTLGESVQKLGTSAQETASTSNEQAAAVKEVLSTMEDADRLSKGVEVKVQEVARIAASTKENVERGFLLIKTSLAKMEEIRSTNGDTISGIKTLGDRIESIWDIVNIINSIADQTKIIAFNAELEAAAAGEAGKNFRIVAGEIRRLADSTVESTGEIKVKINEIQHASDKLIIASEQGTQRIREGWEVSNDIRGVFEDVLRSSEVSATSAGDISRSMSMQVSSFEQIFMTLKQISESIDSLVESISYTTETADNLSEIAGSLRDRVAQYTLNEES